MSTLLEHVNRVAPDQFGDLHADSVGGTFTGLAVMPVTSVTRILTQVVFLLITECGGDTRQPQ
jgi:hypothetical protein